MPTESPNHYIRYAGRIHEEGEKALREACEAAVRANKDRIFVLIDSLGGKTNSGLDMSYMLQELGRPVTTYGETNVESAASFVFLGGEERILHPRRHMMFHPQEFNLGTVLESWSELDVVRYLTLIKSERRRLETLVSSRTTVPPRIIRAMFREHTVVIDPVQGIRWGLVHKMEKLRIPDGIEVQEFNYRKKSDPEAGAADAQ